MAHHAESRKLTRREFTSASISALFVGMAVTLTACKAGGSGSAALGPTPVPPTNPTQSGDDVGAVSANHGHSAVVTRAQLLAGGAVSLNIKGSADHEHVVDLTSAQVQQVAAGAKVSAPSSSGTTQVGDGYGGYTPYEHSHTVTFN
jgi:hypothetical protein